MMDYGLTEEQVMMREVAHELAEEVIRPVAAHYDETNEFPWPVVEKMAATDIFAVMIPEEYGGTDGGTTVLNMYLVTEELSRACGGISLAFAATGLGTMPILISASPEQKAAWLPDIASGKKLAAFG